MTIDNLQAMTREQLVDLASKQGLRVHHKAKPETIIKQLLDQLATVQTDQIIQHIKGKENSRPPKPVHQHTPDQVEMAITHIKQNKPAFTSKYDGDVFHFRCLGAEESGNINQSMNMLVQIASSVARGRRALVTPNQRFDDLGAAGDNAYTNVVIAG